MFRPELEGYDYYVSSVSSLSMATTTTSRPVTRCEAVGRPKGSVDPEGVSTTGARGCPPENFLEIQL